MRVGQKNKLTYRWARKGSRPRAAHDQRTQSTYLFGAVCPERGAGAALVLPACNCEAMQLHLDEIATKVTLGAHAIILLDQAGWHRQSASGSEQYLTRAAAAARTRTQRPGKHLAVHASELVVKPDLQILRRYRRPLLLRLEHTHRPALEDYVHRATRLGSSRSLNLRIGISLVFTQTRVTRRIAMQRQSRSLPQPSTGLAVPTRWRPSCGLLCCRFGLSWLMTSLSDAISNGGSQGDAHGRKRALI